MSFIESIFAQAQKMNKTIVLPESNDARVVEAAQRCVKEGIAKIILIGRPEESLACCPNADLSGIEFIDPATSPEYERFVGEFHELRKAKGMTIEKARETMLDYTSFGMMLLRANLADGLVSGAAHSTADTLRPALQILKTKPGTKMVSAFFMIIVPNCEYGNNGTFLFADCGLVENPDADQLSEIAVASADSFRFLTGEEPVIAMLSYSSQGSAHSELTEKVTLATRLAKEKAPHLKLDGELQVDAALVAKTGKSKAPNSTVQGDANVLIFPDLNAGNISYKLAQYLGKAEAYGPLLQGIARPVNDLSRGCSADDIVGVVAITSVQAAAE